MVCPGSVCIALVCMCVVSMWRVLCPWIVCSCLVVCACERAGIIVYVDAFCVFVHTKFVVDGARVRCPGGARWGWTKSVAVYVDFSLARPLASSSMCDRKLVILACLRVSFLCWQIHVGCWMYIQSLLANMQIRNAKRVSSTNDEQLYLSIKYVAICDIFHSGPFSIGVHFGLSTRACE